MIFYCSGCTLQCTLNLTEEMTCRNENKEEINKKEFFSMKKNHDMQPLGEGLQYMNRAAELDYKSVRSRNFTVQQIEP